VKESKADLAMRCNSKNEKRAILPIGVRIERKLREGGFKGKNRPGWPRVEGGISTRRTRRGKRAENGAKRLNRGEREDSEIISTKRYIDRKKK